MQVTLTSAEKLEIAKEVLAMLPKENKTTAPRMRLLADAAAEIKQMDPQTGVTTNCIRELALSGTIPSVMVGRKRLINFDSLLDYLNSMNVELNGEATSKSITGIRVIKE